MKVESQKPTEPRSEKTNPPQANEKAGTSRFHTVLERKHDGLDKKRRSLENMPQEKESNPDPKAESLPVPHFRPVEIDKTEAPRPVAPSQLVDGLVREISVVTTDLRQEVRIELDSRTLDGLQIKIAKEDGNVSVQFVTSSVEVERLLHRNMDQLIHGLSDRGVNLTSHRVERTASRYGRQQQGRHR